MNEEYSKEIKELLEKNIALTEEVYKMTKKIKSFITFQKIMSFVYFLLIVVPIILSIIFLPPLLKNVFSQYRELLSGEGGSGNLIEGLLKQGVGGLDLKNIDVNQLPSELRKMVK